jgi:cytochrome c oxidase subunit 2
MRFRSKGDDAAIPEQVHGNPQLEMAWTILPVFILMHIAIPTVQFIFKSQAPAPPDAVKVNATGKQWWFSFEYPAEGFTTANEMHIPINKQVDIRLQSDNVIHSFWIPELAGKRDMIPGRVNHLTFIPSMEGPFLGQCAEYCGDSHALMKFRIIVDSPEKYAAWVDNQKKDATVDPAVSAGAEVFKAKCGSCHTIRGVKADVAACPDLTHVASRSTIAAGVLDNNADNLKKWITNPSSVKPGAKMMYANAQLTPTADEINSVVAFLQTLK